MKHLLLCATTLVIMAGCGSEDCTTSCIRYGTCEPASSEDGFYEICAATSDSDCADSWVCATKGRCVVSTRRICEVSAEGCKASDRCKTLGLCTLKGTTCVAATDADCGRSMVCTGANRACKPDSGECVP